MLSGSLYRVLLCKITFFMRSYFSLTISKGIFVNLKSVLLQTNRSEMAASSLKDSLLILCLFGLALLALGQDYDYYGNYPSFGKGFEEDPCSENPIDNSLKCNRYTSCTECADTVIACSCHSHCHYYNDCCPDVSPTSTYSQQPNNIKSGEAITLTKDQFECKKRTVNDFNGIGLMVINRCPAGNSMADEEELCSHRRMFLAHTSPPYFNIHAQIFYYTCARILIYMHKYTKQLGLLEI